MLMSIPFKHGKEFDLTILKRFLRAEKGQVDEGYVGVDDDLNEVQALRARSLCVEAASQVGAETLIRYMSALLKLEPLLAECNDPLNGVVWQDAFDLKKSTQLGSVAFEKCCVLFNLGSLESELGSNCDRSSEEGLKAACHHFQLAAGYYTNIKDSQSTALIGALTPDLTPDGLCVAVTLCLAQAQACFYEKAVNTKTRAKLKASVIAKLGQQCSILYGQAVDYLGAPNLAPHIDRSWASTCEFQQKAFAAAAFFWQAVALFEEAEHKGSGYGLAIVAFKRAESAAAGALELSRRRSLPPRLTAATVTLQERIVKERSQLTKDNDVIYMETLPAANTLPAIGGVQMAKPSFIELPVDEKLFRGILTQPVRSALLKYRESVAQILLNTQERVTEVNASSKDALEKGSISLEGDAAGVPDSLWAKVESTKRNGGCPALRAKKRELEDMAEEARRILEQVNSTLDNECKVDEDFHQRFGTALEGRGAKSSKTLMVDLRQDHSHYLRLWTQARGSDANVLRQINEGMRDLELLERSKEDLEEVLESQLPTDAEGRRSKPKVDLGTLSSLMNDLSKLIMCRDSKMKELESTVKAEDGVVPHKLSIRASEGEPAVQAVAGEALHYLCGLARSLEASVAEEKAMVQKLVQENLEVRKKIEADSIAVAVGAFLARLRGAISTYQESMANLKHGLTFYGDLLERLKQLHTACTDLVYARAISRTEFEVQYTHRQGQQQTLNGDAELASRMNAMHYSKPPGTTAPPSSLSFRAAPASRNDFLSQQEQPPPQPPRDSTGVNPFLSAAIAPPGLSSSGYPGHQQRPQQPQQLQGGGVTDSFNDVPSTLDYKVARLIEMGFSAEQAVSALQASNGKEEAAVMKLLGNA